MATGQGPRTAIVLCIVLLLVALTPGCLSRQETRLVQLTDGPYNLVRERDSVQLDGDLLLFSRTGSRFEKDNMTGLKQQVWDNGTFVKDLSDGTLMKVADEVLEASLSQNHIVWRDGDDIIYQNVYTGVNTTVPLVGAKPLVRPDIYHDLIVWSDSRNDPVVEDALDVVDIYLYDISNETEVRLTTNVSAKGAPTIWGDLVVWSDDRNGNFDIYAYDLSNGSEFQVTHDENGQFSPKASDGAIAWMDTRTSTHYWQEDIFYLDLGTWEERQASRTGSVQSFDISGRTIVWEDTSRENMPFEDGDIIRHDIGPNRTKSHFSSDRSQWCPAISEHKVVWIDNMAEGGEIFTRETIERPILGLDRYTFIFVIVVIMVGLSSIAAYRRVQRTRVEGVDWKKERREKKAGRKRRKGPSAKGRPRERKRPSAKGRPRSDPRKKRPGTRR